MFAAHNMTIPKQENCPCGNPKDYTECCGRIHTDLRNANTAEELMRARYCAFVKHNIEFIYNTFHPSTRRFQNKKEIELWAKQSKWMQLEIICATTNTVEFKAHYLDATPEIQIHHEKSTFKQFQHCWYYVDGRILS